MGDIDQETLKNNFKKLKMKIIDTGKLVELYKATQRNLENALQREDSLKNQLHEVSQIYGIQFDKEIANIENNGFQYGSTPVSLQDTTPNSHLKLKISYAYETINALNKKNWDLEKEVQMLKDKIQLKQTIIQSNQALIQQLQAKLDAKLTNEDVSNDYEALKKENKELKSSLSLKEQKIESLRNKIIELKKNKKRIYTKQQDDQESITVAQIEKDLPVSEIEIPELETNENFEQKEIDKTILSKIPNIQKSNNNTNNNTDITIITEKKLIKKSQDPKLNNKPAEIIEEAKITPSYTIKFNPISKWEPYEDIDTLERAFIDAITKYGKCVNNNALNEKQIQVIKEVSFRCSDFQTNHIIVSFISCIIAIIHKLPLTSDKIFELIDNGIDLELFILTLFWNIAHNHQTESVDSLICNFLAHISSILLFRKDLNDITLVLLTRILTKFCLYYGWMDRIKIFLYDLIRERQEIDFKIVLSIDSIEEILHSFMTKSGFLENNKSILGLTILNILDDHIRKNTNPEDITEETKYILNQWNNKIRLNHENSFKSLNEWIDYLFNLFIKIKMNEIHADNDIIFEIIKSIELIYKVKGNKYMDSLLEKIDPLSHQYLRSLLNL